MTERDKLWWSTFHAFIAARVGILGARKGADEIHGFTPGSFRLKKADD